MISNLHFLLNSVKRNSVRTHEVFSAFRASVKGGRFGVKTLVRLVSSQV